MCLEDSLESAQNAPEKILYTIQHTRATASHDADGLSTRPVQRALSAIPIYDEVISPPVDVSFDLATSTSREPQVVSLTALSLDAQIYLQDLDSSQSNNPKFLTTQVKLLLKHYRTVVISFFGILDNAQTPWKMLHFPKATQAACEFELGMVPRGAPNILLHTVLTISAFSLQNLSHRNSSEHASRQWGALAIQYRSEALALLAAHLDSNMSGIDESEYQELLAAVLSMVSIDVSFNCGC